MPPDLGRSAAALRFLLSDAVVLSFWTRSSRAPRRNGGAFSTVAAEVERLEARQLLSATNGGGDDDQTGQGSYADYLNRVRIADGRYAASIGDAVARYRDRAGAANAALNAVFASADADYRRAAENAAQPYLAAATSATMQYDAALDGADAVHESAIVTALTVHAAELDAADARFDAAAQTATEAFAAAAVAAAVTLAGEQNAAEWAYEDEVFAADLEFLAKSITAAERYEAAERAAWATYEGDERTAEAERNAAHAAADVAVNALSGSAEDEYQAALAQAEHDYGNALDAAYDSGGDDESSSGYDDAAVRRAEQDYQNARRAAEDIYYTAYGDAWSLYVGLTAAAEADYDRALSEAYDAADGRILDARRIREAAVETAHAAWIPKEQAAAIVMERDLEAAGAKFADTLAVPAGEYDDAVAKAEADWDADAERAGMEFLRASGEASWRWQVAEMAASFEVIFAQAEAELKFEDAERTANAIYDSRMAEAESKWRDAHDQAESDLKADAAEAEADWNDAETAAYAANAAAFGEYDERAYSPRDRGDGGDPVAEALSGGRWEGLGAVDGRSQARKSFLKSLRDDLGDLFQNNVEWQVHHRHEHALKDVLADLDIDVRINGRENLRLLPASIHAEITAEQTLFWEQVRREVDDHLKKKNRPAFRETPSYVQLVKNHPDRARLKTQYEAFIKHIDGKFDAYWLKAKEGDAELKAVVARLGVGRERAISGQVSGVLLRRLRNRDDLDLLILKSGVRSEGVFALLQAGERGVEFVKATDSNELIQFMGWYRAILKKEREGHRMTGEDIQRMGEAFINYLRKAGLTEEELLPFNAALDRILHPYGGRPT